MIRHEDLVPSPALIAAREKLIEAYIATPAEKWNPPYKKPGWMTPRLPKPAPKAEVPTDLLTIDLLLEKAAVGRLYVAWQGKLAEKSAVVQYAAEHKVNPGDNYWLEEAKARARYIVAANFVEMLEQARRAPS